MGCCSAFLEAAELLPPPLDEISLVANFINNSPDLMSEMEISDRRALLGPMAQLFEQHIVEASATDLSRLAWLHLHRGDSGRALEVAELGITREQTNVHCQRLVAKLAAGR